MLHALAVTQNTTQPVLCAICRCLTERQGKKFGTVIDYCPSRMLRAMFEYGTSGGGLQRSTPELVLQRLLGHVFEIKRGELSNHDGTLHFVDVPLPGAVQLLRASLLQELPDVRKQVACLLGMQLPALSQEDLGRLKSIFIPSSSSK